MTSDQIQINPEFQKLIPPLSPDEFAQLEANILDEGIRDPLVVWRQTGYLVDGHNRYQIAQKHGLEYAVHEKDFADKEEVRSWMDENQIGRRNLHPKHFKILLGRIYNRKKKAQGAPKGNANRAENKVPKSGTLKTHEQVASQFGVGKNTVHAAGKQYAVVSELATATGKSEFEVIDEIGKDKHINRIHSRKKKEPERPITEIADEVMAEAKQREEKQTQNRQEVKQTLERLSLLDVVGGKKYRLIYADPPWQYNDGMKIDGYTGVGDHYLSMPLDAICKMPVRQITEDNAILFLWVTSPFLEDSFRVINSWGFKYKASFVWDKVGHAMGHYNSVRHEFLLVATRGSCTPDHIKLFDSVQSIQKTRKHSEKPEEFRAIIDTLYTWGSKIELFARTAPEGWDVFGNQIESNDRVLQN